MSDTQPTVPDRYRGLVPFTGASDPRRNSGGVPKWLKQAKAALKKHAVRAAEVLAEVMETGTGKEKVAAAKVVLEFTVPKPTEKKQVEVTAKLPKVPSELAARLAALDS